jgi:hypothetical protein
MGESGMITATASFVVATAVQPPDRKPWRKWRRLRRPVCVRLVQEVERIVGHW